MLKQTRTLLLICFFTLSLGWMNFAQTDDNQLLAPVGRFWMLPTAECSGENSCEVRVSPQATIYSWDNINRRLYVSPTNQERYDVYDLSEFSDYLGFRTDFVPFEQEGYVFFLSSFGFPINYLTRYDLNSGTIELVQSHEEDEIEGCNTLGFAIREFRFIFPIGLDGHLALCKHSSENNRPLIQILDVETLNVNLTLDTQTIYLNRTRPAWHVIAGLDNRIYARVQRPEAMIPDPPQIDETTEEIILAFDLETSNWTYEVLPLELMGIILGVFPDGSIVSLHFGNNGERSLVVTDDFQITHTVQGGTFLGISESGDLFYLLNDTFFVINITGG